VPSKIKGGPERPPLVRQLYSNRKVVIGAKVVRHARYITFQLAEVAITRKLFEAILQKIDRLRLLPDTG
jgi:hypothetical protein